jgi:hypothetical protein
LVSNLTGDAALTIGETPTESDTYPTADPGVYPYAPAGLTGPPFFTPYDLAARLQIDPDTINTDTATLFAQLASDTVRDDLRLQVDHIADETITIWGDGGESLVLPQRPVTAVSSVTLAGTPMVPVQPNTTGSPMFDWRPAGTLLRVVYGGSPNTRAVYCPWPQGVPVTITYSHGWQTIPSVFQSVALELAAAAYSNPEMYDSGRIGWTEWATSASGNLNREQRAALDLYRRLSV